jgi:predicted ATPase
LLERDAGTVRARDESGAWVVFPFAVSPSETALGELREPHRFPVLSAIRQELMEWRFYHHFRTDLNSPLRWPRPGCQTPVLDHQGHDLAAALATIDEIGNRPELARSIDRAFPGCTLEIRGPSREHPADGFSFALKDPNFQRSLGAGELSDGTLHYLCLVAALMSPRPPNMLVLNEPETSIYPQLLEPLACLIAQASENSQVWLTTHSQTLAESLHRICGIEPIALCKTNGATQVKSIE